MTRPSGIVAPGDSFVYEEDKANIGHDVEEVRRQATVEALQTLVPPGFFDAVS